MLSLILTWLCLNSQTNIYNLNSLIDLSRGNIEKISSSILISSLELSPINQTKINNLNYTFQKSVSQKKNYTFQKSVSLKCNNFVKTFSKSLKCDNFVNTFSKSLICPLELSLENKINFISWIPES